MGRVRRTQPKQRTGGIDSYKQGKAPYYRALRSAARSIIMRALYENDYNRTHTAKALGLQRTYFLKLLNELDIQRDGT